MACAGFEPGTYITTYREDYRPCYDLLPPIKFNQTPAFALPNVPKLLPREFPLIPKAPHRRVEVDIPLGPGLGTKDLNTAKYLDPKPIVKTVPPREAINLPLSILKSKKNASQLRKTVHFPLTLGDFEDEEKLLPEDLIEALCVNLKYTSTTRQASEEQEALLPKPVDPPISTFEKKADMVRFRPKLYEDEPGDWQRVQVPWDRAQTRPRIDRPVATRHVDTRPSRLLPMRRQKENHIAVDGKIKDLIVKDRLAAPFVRQCPGYAGFIPRSPIEASLEKTDPSPCTETVMKVSYRPLPQRAYQILDYAHKGPMSHTVTLTSPYNPFNKIEKRVA